MSNNKDDMTKTTMRISKSLLKEVKQYALDHDMNVTQIFNESLKEYLHNRVDNKSTKK